MPVSPYNELQENTEEAIFKHDRDSDAILVTEKFLLGI